MSDEKSKRPSKQSAFWVQWLLSASPEEIEQHNREVFIKGAAMLGLFVLAVVALIVTANVNACPCHP